MLLNVCIAKLHRATVTDADLNYIGSITIDELLLEAAGLREGQMVKVAEWFDRAASSAGEDSVLARIRGEVREFTRQYPLPHLEASLAQAAQR